MMKKQKEGFTLIEMLVVISVLSVVGVLILTIFIRTLRGNNKAQLIGVIKQNGQSVLENIDKTIRDSDHVFCPVSLIPPSTTLVVLSLKNNTYTRYRFIPATTMVNGLIQQDNPVKPQGTDDTLFINTVCNVTDPMPGSLILTDNNKQTGVSIENGSFVNDRSVGFNDQVTIKFDVKTGVDAPPAVAGQIDAVNFQTTIQLRPSK